MSEFGVKNHTKLAYQTRQVHLYPFYFKIIYFIKFLEWSGIDVSHIIYVKYQNYMSSHICYHTPCIRYIRIRCQNPVKYLLIRIKFTETILQNLLCLLFNPTIRILNLLIEIHRSRHRISDSITEFWDFSSQ